MKNFQAAYWLLLLVMGFGAALSAPAQDDHVDCDVCVRAALRHDLERADRALDALLLRVMEPLDAWLSVQGPRVAMRKPPGDGMPFADGDLRPGAPFYYTLRLEFEGETVAAWHFRITNDDRGRVKGYAGDLGAEGSYEYEVDEDDEQYAQRVRDDVAAAVRAYAKATDDAGREALRLGVAHLYNRPTFDTPPERLHKGLRIF